MYNSKNLFFALHTFLPWNISCLQILIISLWVFAQDSFLWKLSFHIYIPTYFTQNPSAICKKSVSYVKLSVNQKPNVHFYGNDLCKAAIWSIIIVTWERNNGERGPRTHGRNTNVITISSYLSDLEIQNVHSPK